MAELWTSFAELADTALQDEKLRDEEELHVRLFLAIDSVLREPPERLAWNILARVSGWFRARKQGKATLWALLADRVRHGGVLSEGLRFLECFDRSEQLLLLRKWLTTDLSPPILPTRAFARQAGQHVGWAAMIRYETGEETGSLDLVEELLKHPPADGLLSDLELYTLFIGQSVFGAKEAVAGGGVPLTRANEFAARMAQCWRALLASLDENERERDAPAFALWVFHPILDKERERLKPDPDERKEWWLTLNLLAIEIVRDGPSYEISSLLRCLQQSPLLVQIAGDGLLEVFETLHDRTPTLNRDGLGLHWRHALASAAAAIEVVFERTSDSTARDKLYSYVASWGAPPLANEEAAAVARRLRR